MGFPKKERRHFVFRFGYAGHRFHGVQPQPGLPTVVSALRARLDDAAQQRVRRLTVAARTDAKVHALRSIATGFFDPTLDVERFVRAVEAPREDGLFALTATRAPYTVHARGQSRGKRYRYIVDDGCDTTEWVTRFAWRIHPRINLERMRAAAAMLKGTHDFSSLRSAGCTASTPIKTIADIRISDPFPLDGGRRRFFIEVVGNAFVRKMVRAMVGTLVEVGTGWRPLEDLGPMLAARNRKRGGMTAPAQGLSLSQIGFAWPDDGAWRLAEFPDDNLVIPSGDSAV